MVKANELRNMSDQERDKKLRDLQVELTKAKSSQSGGKVKDIKKMIARIKTINSSKSRGAEKK